MCEQCCANTQTYILSEEETHVFPGIFLVRATEDGMQMKKGDWGLVRCNDPDVFWSKDPEKDPCWDLSDEEVDNSEAGEWVKWFAVCGLRFAVITNTISLINCQPPTDN